MDKPFMVRQGDVFIRKVADDVKVGEEIKRDKDRVILAYGEVTGHAHAITDKNAVLFQALDPKAIELGTRFLKILDKVATLNHDEHGSINLPQGTYEVVTQVEYTPQGLRNVAD